MADEGLTIPLGYGTFVVAPNIVAITDIRPPLANSKGTFYYAASMTAASCLDE